MTKVDVAICAYAKPFQTAGSPLSCSRVISILIVYAPGD
jgi:hypothetical protein